MRRKGGGGYLNPMNLWFFLHTGEPDDFLISIQNQISKETMR